MFLLVQGIYLYMTLYTLLHTPPIYPVLTSHTLPLHQYTVDTTATHFP